MQNRNENGTNFRSIYECSFCNKCFKYNYLFQNHLREGHTQNNQTGTKIKGIWRYPCSMCDKFFASKLHLQAHDRIHFNDRCKTSREELNKCPVCKMTIYNQGNFKRHMKRHFKLGYSQTRNISQINEVNESMDKKQINGKNQASDENQANGKIKANGMKQNNAMKRVNNTVQNCCLCMVWARDPNKHVKITMADGRTICSNHTCHYQYWQLLLENSHQNFSWHESCFLIPKDGHENWKESESSIFCQREALKTGASLNILKMGDGQTQSLSSSACTRGTSPDLHNSKEPYVINIKTEEDM